MSVTYRPNHPIVDDSNFYFGLILALSSSLFIGSSFIIKKKALIKLNRKGALRAGSGGYGYLKEWLWWTGLLCMGFGEVSNFAAYTLIPASLVTPLGALSVLVSSVLSSIVLKEFLNILGKIGCLLCILGSTIIIIHSPNSEENETLDTILQKLQQHAFISYVFLVIFLASLVTFHFGPKFGTRHILCYIILCSSVGSLTVMFSKCFGTLIKDYFSNKNEKVLQHWLTYSLILSIVVCIVLQMIFLNRSLDLFNTSIVTPVYYVFFTIFVLIATSILFKDYQKLNYVGVIGNICGFLVIVVAVFLLNAFKNFDINLDDMRHILKPKKAISDDLGAADLVNFIRNV